MDTIRTYTDGGARGNPGPAAIGIVICNAEDKILYEKGERIGRATNNQAEYTAVIRALEFAAHYKATHVRCTLDSELVVRQLHGEYKIKNAQLKALFAKLKECERAFEKVTYHHVRRTHPMIRRADRLVNEALDEKN